MSEENKNFSEENENCSSEEKQETSPEFIESSALFGTEDKPHEDIKIKKPKKVSLTAFICTSVALVLAAVMLTYTICSSAYQAKLAKARLEQVAQTQTQSGKYDELELLSKLFEIYSFEELDEQEIKNFILKAYVYATGDRYAEYYTEEEYDALMSDFAGETQGIGINIINSIVSIDGSEYKALRVVNIMENSPAHKKSDLQIGDYIIAVGSKENNTMIDALGYDMALKQLQGVKGTAAEFFVYREGVADPIYFNILREEFTSDSVMSRKAEISGKDNIGVIKIVEFNMTTPTQVKLAIERLKSEGCDKFVFDLRNNPGGECSSIVATLSFFLEEGKTLITIKDKAGNERVTKVAPVQSEGGCSVLAEDIGIYKDLNMVVLCNSGTASAAELFVANFRDHSLGAVVGTTTYGKGSAQSFIDLAYFGYSGVLKITKYMYYPPNGVGYDGIGIEPTVIEELSETTKKYSVYDTWWNEKDNQLVKAVEQFK